MQGIPILNTEVRGLPLSEELLPQYLQQLGYSTHLIGKWHLGHYHKRYTPLQRGFNSHLGFLTGYIGYYNHVCCCIVSLNLIFIVHIFIVLFYLQYRIVFYCKI